MNEEFLWKTALFIASKNNKEFKVGYFKSALSEWCKSEIFRIN